MGDQGNARGEKAGVFGGAGDLRGEFGRESPENRRDVNARLLEYSALQYSHATPAAGRAGVIRPAPGRGGEFSWLQGSWSERPRRFILKGLERGKESRLQGLEPCARRLLALLKECGFL